MTAAPRIPRDVRALLEDIEAWLEEAGVSPDLLDRVTRALNDWTEETQERTP